MRLLTFTSAFCAAFILRAGNWILLNVVLYKPLKILVNVKFSIAMAGDGDGRGTAMAGGTGVILSETKKGDIQN
jgi:hypothetical protein